MTSLTTIRRLLLSALVAGAGLISTDRAEAAFHLWEIREIYSNADGSVQFIELFNNFSGEEFVQGKTVLTYRDGGEDEQSFTFPSNLDTDGESTANRSMLLATGPIEGVEPDFVIPENFIPIEFQETGTVDISGFATAGNPRITTYSSIPTDGFRSLDGQGNVQDPATVTNFAGDTAELSPPEDPVPPEVFGLDFRDNAFEMAFTTESGRTYTVEFTDSLAEEDWQTLETVAGDGETAEIIDEAPDSPSRFYRVLVE